MLKKIFLTITLILAELITFAQQKANNVEMADQLRESGKIYIVVICGLVIFIGIIIYLIIIDKKLKKLEKEKDSFNHDEN